MPGFLPSFTTAALRASELRQNFQPPLAKICLDFSFFARKIIFVSKSGNRSSTKYYSFRKASSLSSFFCFFHLLLRKDFLEKKQNVFIYL